MKLCYTVRISGIQNYINLERRRISFIIVKASILVSDALITELDICKSELTIYVGISSCEDVVYKVIVYRFTEYIKYLRSKFKLFHLNDKSIILALCLQIINISSNFSDNISCYILNCRWIQITLAEQMNHFQQRHKIVINLQAANIICQ